jgi:hypothetical protein
MKVSEDSKVSGEFIVLEDSKVSDISTASKVSDISTASKVSDISTASKVSDISTASKVSDISTASKVYEPTKKFISSLFSNIFNKIGGAITILIAYIMKMNLNIIKKSSPKVLEEQKVLEEPKVLEESTVSEKPTVLEESTVSEKPTVLEESTVSEKPTVLKESTVLEKSMSSIFSSLVTLSNLFFNFFDKSRGIITASIAHIVFKINFNSIKKSGTTINGNIESGTTINGNIESGTTINGNIESGTTINGNIESGTTINDNDIITTYNQYYNIDKNTTVSNMLLNIHMQLNNIINKNLTEDEKSIIKKSLELYDILIKQITNKLE